MVQNNEGPKDLEVAKNGFMDARKKQKVKKKNGNAKKETESMESKHEKKVKCIYFKKSNKESKGLSDTNCRQEIRSPQEMMQHIQKEHPWLNWSIETSKKHFEEEIEALEDNNMEVLEHDLNRYAAQVSGGGREGGRDDPGRVGPGG